MLDEITNYVNWVFVISLMFLVALIILRCLKNRFWSSLVLSKIQEFKNPIVSVYIIFIIIDISCLIPNLVKNTQSNACFVFMETVFLAIGYSVISIINTTIITSSRTCKSTNKYKSANLEIKLEKNNCFKAKAEQENRFAKEEKYNKYFIKMVKSYLKNEKNDNLIKQIENMKSFLYSMIPDALIRATAKQIKENSEIKKSRSSIKSNIIETMESNRTNITFGSYSCNFNKVNNTVVIPEINTTFFFKNNIKDATDYKCVNIYRDNPETNDYRVELVENK